MVNTKNTTPASAQKKKRSSGGLKKHKPTEFNKWMSSELARLKAENIADTHKERWSLACKSWSAKKNSSSSGSSP
ncbi:hypothetical protein FB451DRAFT_1388574 [Mycena latifolia]|nr:hypothetical protein FB451DRAFT_1388574 [Mycena latifolia]